MIVQLLPAPELIPFRLTRNVVDAMGPCGTEGVFQKSMEETTSVLRENARNLLTILSAVVADPLYKWQASVVEARRRQTDKEDRADLERNSKKGRKSGRAKDDAVQPTAMGERNQAATEIISKIKQKLEGYEDSTSGDQQGVEGQVQLLINSARDPNLLAELYKGWAPWV